MVVVVGILTVVRMWSFKVLAFASHYECHVFEWASWDSRYRWNTPMFIKAFSIIMCLVLLRWIKYERSNLTFADLRYRAANLLLCWQLGQLFNPFKLLRQILSIVWWLTLLWKAIFNGILFILKHNFNYFLYKLS